MRLPFLSPPLLIGPSKWRFDRQDGVTRRFSCARVAANAHWRRRLARAARAKCARWTGQSVHVLLVHPPRHEVGERTDELAPLSRCTLHRKLNSMHADPRRTFSDSVLEDGNRARKRHLHLAFHGGKRAVGPEDLLR